MKKFIVTSLYSQGSQAAVQGGHASDELSLKMKKEKSELSELYWKWLEEYKTYVYLEVGSPKEIIELEDWIYLNREELKVSSAVFKEEALNNSVTACSFVAPSKLCEGIQFNVKNLLTELKKAGLTEFEFNSKAFDFFNTSESFKGVWKDFGGYYPIEFILNKDNKIDVYVYESEKVLINSYTPTELNFFLKVRFLRLAK